jgi:hypothetical protein
VEAVDVEAPAGDDDEEEVDEAEVDEAEVDEAAGSFEPVPEVSPDEVSGVPDEPAVRLSVR